MSLAKRIFHQISEIPVISVFLLALFSPIFLTVQIIKTVRNQALNREMIQLIRIIREVIPRENKIITQIKDINDPNIPAETKIEITNHLITVFERCRPNNRAASEIIQHLRQISLLLTKSC